MEKSQIENLISIAIDNLKNSYAPYSHYNVAAAVLMSSGKIYTGVNVENAAYGSTICAERNAIFHAVAEGERKIKAIVIVGDNYAAETGVINDFATPCGSCRQVMREFCDPKKMLVISARSKEDYIVRTLEDYLPYSFGPEYLDD